MFFWETGYSLHTLRQASRRSWRIGRNEEVTVKYSAYANTAQETCLRLMGRKLLVAPAMEGKFSTEGLQSVGEDDDLLMAMARELVTERGIGEAADVTWRRIQKQNEALGYREPRLTNQIQEIEADREGLNPNFVKTRLHVKIARSYAHTAPT